MKIKKYSYLTLLFLVLIFQNCGGTTTNVATNSEESNSGLVLPAILTVVDANLTGIVYVYQTNNNRLLQNDIIFDTDDSGNDLAVTPPMTLTASTSYRFVIVFSLSGTEVAYVDETFTLSSAATTNLSWATADLITSSDSIDDIINSDISVLPQLDIDADGFSNLEEINASSNPEDADSTPN